jgi:DNA-binding LacI/PurR family transcriptional regulator
MNSPAEPQVAAVKQRAVTLQDVADEAGVAVSTASRALSNPDRVSAPTRDHVQSVAMRLGYRHSRMATALETGRTPMLALLVADITNPHNFGLIRGAEAQARAAGYTLIIGNTQESPEFERAHAERLGSAVAGFVLASSRLPDDELLELAEQRPVVLYNRQVAGLPSVVSDSADAGRQIIDHLAALGHRSLTYLGGPANAWVDGERSRALSDSAERAGLKVIRRGPFAPTLEGGSAAADIGVASGTTALVAFNDLLAIGVLQRLQHLGIDVPGEVSVVGFDDIFGSDFCHPPLSTVTAPVEQAGRTLIDLLLGARDLVGARDARSAPRIALPTVLRVRDSTGPVLNLGRLLISQEFGQRLSDRTRGFGGRQMAAPCEYPQSAAGDCVGVLLSANRWHDAVVLAGSEQERNRDPVKVRATVELRESLAGQRVGLSVGIRQGLQQPPGGVAVTLQETGGEPPLGGTGQHDLRTGLADEFGSLPPRGRLADA